MYVVEQLYKLELLYKWQIHIQGDLKSSLDFKPSLNFKSLLDSGFQILSEKISNPLAAFQILSGFLIYSGFKLLSTVNPLNLYFSLWISNPLYREDQKSWSVGGQ
jgi:hypothetical protein